MKPDSTVSLVILLTITFRFSTGRTDVIGLSDSASDSTETSSSPQAPQSPLNKRPGTGNRAPEILADTTAVTGELTGNEQDDEDDHGRSCDFISRTSGQDMSSLCENDVGAWSCRGRCGDTLTSPCSCHPACVVYHACCEDIEIECPNEYWIGVRDVDRYPHARPECHPTHNILMISHCPPDAKYTSKQFCESAGTNDDYLISFTYPVTDLRLMWTFKNSICWSCWNTINSSMAYWSYRFQHEVSFGNTQMYDRANVNRVHSQAISMARVAPAGVPQFRCPSSRIVDSLDCAACGIITQEHLACDQAHTSYVRISNIIYRNYHCYLCQKASFLTALANSSGEASSAAENTTCVIVPLEVNTGRKVRDDQFSFTMKPSGLGELSNEFIVDYSPSTPAAPQSEVRNNEQVTWKRIRCVRQECEAMECRRGFANVNGVCRNDLHVWILATKMCFTSRGDNETNVKCNGVASPEETSSSSSSAAAAAAVTEDNHQGTGLRDLYTIPVLAKEKDRSTFQVIPLQFEDFGDMLFYLATAAGDGVDSVSGSDDARRFDGSTDFQLIPVDAKDLEDFVTNVTIDALGETAVWGNMSVNSKTLLQVNSLELFSLLVLISDNASVSSQPSLADTLPTALAQYLVDYVTFKSVRMCTHSMAGLVLDDRALLNPDVCKSIDGKKPEPTVGTTPGALMTVTGNATESGAESVMSRRSWEANTLIVLSVLSAGVT